MYYCHLFLTCSSSIRSIPFLSLIIPIFAWNVPLVSLIFLKRSLVFPILLFSSVSLHWSLRKDFLSLLAILWNSAFKWVYLPFLLCLPFSSLLSYLYLHDPDNHNGVITHLEPDILECEVKWALESITRNKTSGGDGIPVELFQILLRWSCESAALNMPANLENSAVATGLEKVSFHSSPTERQCQRCSNYHTIVLISHASKIMLKILQARLQQYVNHELPDVQAGF